jgi:FkbM family methyltransferase
MIEKIKYNLLLNFFKNKKKLLWTLTNNLLSSSISIPSISVLKLSTDTTIGKKNEKIYVTNDSYQTWYIINNKNFHKKFVEKIKDLTDKNVNYNFIDIGANTGLLTKSLLNNLDHIKSAFLIEPDQDNFFCLKNNLYKYKNAQIFNFALDTKDGEKKLFLDKNNKGNLSFNYEMMTLKEDKLNFMNSPDNYEIVNCKSVKNFFNEINNEINNENKNIIKIDVQGHDETIFQEIPENILKNTEILIIEITPLETKKFDLDKFNSKLKIFSKYTNFENDSITFDQINKFVNMSSGESIDLILIK